MNPDPAESLPPKTRRVQGKLDQALGDIDTPREAESVLQKAQAAAEGHRTSGQGEPANVVAQVARQAHAEADENAPVNQAVEQATSGQRREPIPPESARGLALLRRALVRRLGPLQALDVSAYLAINHLPHPRAADRWLGRLSWVMTGGFGWVPLLLLSLAGAKERPRGSTTLRVLPALWLATFTVEHLIKRLFRRRRPFIDSVQAIVVGRKPGSYSFPSGHSAAAFAGATLLASEFPAGRPFYCAIALLTAFSRTYLGAHYPGDVLSGSLAGALLARVYRALLRRLF